MRAMSDFDMDKWLSEGQAAHRELLRIREEKQARLEQLTAELEKLDEDIGRLGDVLLASDGLSVEHQEEARSRHNVTAAAREFMGKVEHGAVLGFEAIENGVAEQMEGEVPKTSTLKGALRKLVSEGIVQKVGDEWKKTGGFPKLDDEEMDGLVERLTERLRMAGDEGIIPTSFEERRVLEYWASKWLVELVKDTDEPVYRIKDESLLTPEEAPIHRKKLFDGVEPPRHAR